MSKTNNQRIHALEVQVKALMDKVILDQPKLKQLDHSVFDGQDKKWRFAAVDSSGDGALYTHYPRQANLHYMVTKGKFKHIGDNYDATYWENSLIDRKTKELTGSDLCRAMLERGDKIVTCATSDMSDADAVEHENYDAITGFNGELSYPFESHSDSYTYTVPVNNQGEPLTAADVGL